MSEAPEHDMTWYTSYYDIRSTYAINPVDSIDTIALAGSQKFSYGWYNLPNLNFDNPDVRK